MNATTYPTSATPEAFEAYKATVAAEHAKRQAKRVAAANLTDETPAAKKATKTSPSLQARREAIAPTPATLEALAQADGADPVADLIDRFGGRADAAHAAADDLRDEPQAAKAAPVVTRKGMTREERRAVLNGDPLPTKTDETAALLDSWTAEAAAKAEADRAAAAAEAAKQEPDAIALLRNLAPKPAAELSALRASRAAEKAALAAAGVVDAMPRKFQDLIAILTGDGLLRSEVETSDLRVAPSGDLMWRKGRYGDTHWMAPYAIPADLKPALADVATRCADEKVRAFFG